MKEKIIFPVVVVDDSNDVTICRTIEDLLSIPDGESWTIQEDIFTIFDSNGKKMKYFENNGEINIRMIEIDCSAEIFLMLEEFVKHLIRNRQLQLNITDLPNDLSTTYDYIDRIKESINNQSTISNMIAWAKKMLNI